MDSGPGMQPYGAAAEDALMASLLLGASIPEHEVQQREGKRPRLDSEMSLDALSEMASRRNLRSAAQGTSDGDSSQDDSEDADEEQTRKVYDERPFEANGSAPQNLPVMQLSMAATEFYIRRREAMELAAMSRDDGAPPPIVELVHGILTPEQAEILNREGRVGIYWPQERSYIIERFLTKRVRRAWAKKIRYGCRKSLADRRIRVKGRFVRAEIAAEIAVQASSSGSSGQQASRSSWPEGLVECASGSGGSSGSAGALTLGAYIPAGAARADALRHAMERGSAYATGAVQRRGRGYSVDSVGAASMGMASAPMHIPHSSSPKTVPKPQAVGRARPRASSFHLALNGKSSTANGGVLFGVGGALPELTHSSNSNGGKSSGKGTARSNRGSAEDSNENPFQYEISLPSMAASLSRKRARSASFSLAGPVSVAPMPVPMVGDVVVATSTSSH